jgi:hypothetical protein
MDLKIINVFSSLDDKIKNDLAEETYPLRLGLIALSLVHSEYPSEYLSSSEIALCLENAGVSVRPNSITKSFARAGNKLSKESKNNVTSYKIMTTGKKAVSDFFSNDGNQRVIIINNSEPYTSSIKIGDLLQQLNGEIRICDPYFGSRSFAILLNIKKSCVIRFLTVNVRENQNKIKTNHKDFLKENPKFQLRIFPNKTEIHDRYILSDDKLAIIGHGLKDIGKKESFILVLDKGNCKDIYKLISETFEKRWGKSNPF